MSPHRYFIVDKWHYMVDKASKYHSLYIKITKWFCYAMRSMQGEEQQQQLVSIVSASNKDAIKDGIDEGARQSSPHSQTYREIQEGYDNFTSN
jgi:hypothetical protein